MTPALRKQLEAEAEKYAEVEVDRIDKFGRKLYSAASPYVLSMAEPRICAYLSGAEAGFKLALKMAAEKAESCDYCRAYEEILVLGD